MVGHGTSRLGKINMLPYDTVLLIARPNPPQFPACASIFTHCLLLLALPVEKVSIGIEILKCLLSGSAHVIITTSRYCRAIVEYYWGIFLCFDSRGSTLTVVSFNESFKQGTCI